MKIRKTATQQNFIINKWYYSEDDLRTMLLTRQIFTFEDKTLNEVYPYEAKSWELEEMTFRIFAEDLEEVKVVCEDGSYLTVAIGKNGKKYYVEL